jgi:hypothetical protein
MDIPDSEQRDDLIEQIIAALEGMLRQRTQYPTWISDNEFEQLCRDIIRPKGVPLQH